MKVMLNFFKGFKNTGKLTRMVILLLVINLAFSMILAVPMYHSLKDSFGNSLAGERMSEGFDYLWWEEYRDEAQGLEQTFTPSIIGKGAILNNLEGLIQLRVFDLPPIILIFGLLYIILHTFLAGGILSLFRKGDANERDRFLRGLPVLLGIDFQRSCIFPVLVHPNGFRLRTDQDRCGGQYKCPDIRSRRIRVRFSASRLHTRPLLSPVHRADCIYPDLYPDPGSHPSILFFGCRPSIPVPADFHFRTDLDPLLALLLPDGTLQISKIRIFLLALRLSFLIYSLSKSIALFD